MKGGVKMRKHRISIILTLLFILATLLTLAMAAERKIPLKGDFWRRASGEVVIKDMAPDQKDQKEITINMKNLRANAVYTVWFVNMKPEMKMAGIGTADYSFKTDSEGNGQYMAAVPASEIEKWDLIEVAYHPDGNPKNMDNIKVALKAKLKSAGKRMDMERRDY